MSAVGSSELNQCAICLEDIQPGADISKLNCNHQFHKKCLLPWLEANHTTCPLDRGKITSINGEPTNYSEVSKETTHDPLAEARDLYQRSIRVIQNPSMQSEDLQESAAAKTQAVAAQFFGGLLD